jgi:hypothetical protein
VTAILKKTLTLSVISDEPHKFNHNAMKMDTHNGQLFLISIDNDRAHWAHHDNSHTTLSAHEKPACDRQPNRSKFTCHHFGQERDGKKLAMRHLASFLGSACLFPRSVASRLKHYSNDEQLQPSLAVQRYISAQHKQALLASDAKHFKESSMSDVFTYNRWNATVIDLRVKFLAETLHRCISTYGYGQVVVGLADQ